MNTFACDLPVPACAITAASPPESVEGTCTLTWYRPAEVKPAKVTDAATPPIETAGWVAAGTGAGSTCPSVAGLVSPNPVPKRVMISPGRAGVVKPGRRLAGPTSEPSA